MPEWKRDSMKPAMRQEKGLDNTPDFVIRLALVIVVLFEGMQTAVDRALITESGRTYVIATVYLFCGAFLGYVLAH